MARTIWPVGGDLERRGWGVLGEDERSELERLAAAAFVYGVPLVEDVGKLVEQVTTSGIPLGAPLNAFGHARELFDAWRGRELGLVGINTDALYSWAQVDVGPEPVVLWVPDAAGRYYVMQFVDAWTNDFAYVGTRATGTAAGEFLIVGPGWQGEAADGMPVIHAPTAMFSIVGRWAVADSSDLPAVHALQDRLMIRALSGSHEPARRAAGVWPYPSPDPRVPKDLVFWEKLRIWSQAFPPHPSEQAHLRSLEPLGLLDRESPYVDAEPQLAAILRAAEAAGPRAVIAASTKLLATRGEWLETRENFNFNQHFFELGTIDSPEWKIADREHAWLIRGREALTAIWGNHAYEAYYPPCFHDADGQPLTGDRRYTLRFVSPPRPTRSGRSRSMTNPAISSSITPSTATPSATAPQTCNTTPTARSTSTSATTRQTPARPTGSPPPSARSCSPCASTGPDPRRSIKRPGRCPPSRRPNRPTPASRALAQRGRAHCHPERRRAASPCAGHVLFSTTSSASRLRDCGSPARQGRVRAKGC